MGGGGALGIKTQKAIGSRGWEPGHWGGGGGGGGALGITKQEAIGREPGGPM